jgi:hypothetical protein
VPTIGSDRERPEYEGTERGEGRNDGISPETVWRGGFMMRKRKKHPAKKAGEID